MNMTKLSYRRTVINELTPAPNSVYMAIAGEVVRRSVLLRNFALSGQESASNPPPSQSGKPLAPI
jgi:hypothetical protein